MGDDVFDNPKDQCVLMHVAQRVTRDKPTHRPRLLRRLGLDWRTPSWSSTRQMAGIGASSSSSSTRRADRLGGGQGRLRDHRRHRTRAAPPRRCADREQDGWTAECRSRRRLPVAHRSTPPTWLTCSRTPDETEQDALDRLDGQREAGPHRRGPAVPGAARLGPRPHRCRSRSRGRGHEVFVVDDGALIACFDDEVTAELVRALAKREPLRAVFRDSGFASDAARINAEQIFRELSPATDVKAI